MTVEYKKRAKKLKRLFFAFPEKKLGFEKEISIPKG